MSGLSFDLPESWLDAVTQRVLERIGSLKADEPEPWIDAAAAAEHLACKPQRIYALVHQGRVPHQKDGSRLLFRRSELDKALRSGGLGLA